jgi:hypothetical protein
MGSNSWLLGAKPLRGEGLLSWIGAAVFVLALGLWLAAQARPAPATA